MTLFLNGTWKVTHRPYQADIQDILAENFVPEGWLNANVPEEIHATLRRAGAIRGNTYDKREDEERWIEEKDWSHSNAREAYLIQWQNHDKLQMLCSPKCLFSCISTRSAL